MMRSQIRKEFASGLPDLLGIPASDSELAGALVRAKNGEALSPSEELQVTLWDELVFRYWENVTTNSGRALRRR